MNLDVFKKKLVAKTASVFSWEELEGDEKTVVLSTYYRVRQFDDLLKIFVQCTKDGLFSTTVVFDKLEYSKDTLKLVNYFNQNVFFLKAYVQKGRDASYLKVDYSCLVKSEDEAVEKFEEALGVLSSQGTAQFLKPLTVITEE